MLPLPQGGRSRDESDLDGDLRGRQAPALRVRRMRKYHSHLRKRGFISPLYVRQAESTDPRGQQGAG